MAHPRWRVNRPHRLLARDRQVTLWVRIPALGNDQRYRTADKQDILTTKRAIKLLNSIRENKEVLSDITQKSLLLLLHPFIGLFSRTTWVSQYQKSKTSLDLNVARDDEVLGWQWHQLDHMQTICTSLQIDNHTNTSSRNFYRPDARPHTQPTVSKHWKQNQVPNAGNSHLIISSTKDKYSVWQHTVSSHYPLITRVTPCAFSWHVWRRGVVVSGFYGLSKS